MYSSAGYEHTHGTRNSFDVVKIKSPAGTLARNVHVYTRKKEKELRTTITMVTAAVLAVPVVPLIPPLVSLVHHYEYSSSSVSANVRRIS